MTIPANTSVLIVGGGPVGLTLANLLGAAGVSTVLVERNPGCVPEPRAVALDGESLRTLQSAGLADEISASIRQGFVASYVNGDGVQLFTTDLSARPYGHCLQNSFDQPTLERQLLAGLSRFASVTALHETELLGFEQHADGVAATLRDGSGGEHQVRADYLVGCDGGRSAVRQALGIAILGDRLPQQWLVIDTVDRHLVGEPECRFFCDPARPAMTILRPGGERRWEWMLMGDETEEEMLDDARIDALLAGHTDTDRVEVYRKCVYRFSSVVAERFREGRVFLAGDAAHMTPPFAGQGLNAGIRDVRNLSWKLAAVLGGSLPPSLLDTYNLERRDAAKAMVDLAVMLGDQIQPTDPAAAAERDAGFAALNADPDAAASFGRDIIAPLYDVRLDVGWFVAGANGGRMLPQPPIAGNNTTTLLDNLLGEGFCALLSGLDQVPEAVAAHPLWQAIAPRVCRLADGGELPTGALQDFIEPGTASITLVRPDRFVLATLRPADDPAAALDDLAGQLR